MRQVWVVESLWSEDKKQEWRLAKVYKSERKANAYCDDRNEDEAEMAELYPNSSRTKYRMWRYLPDVYVAPPKAATEE